MSARRFLLRRVLWTVFATWLLLSGTFLVFAYAPDPNEALVGFGAGFGAATSGENASEAAQEAMATYREARNYDDPIHERYLRWMVGYATLDWGRAYTERTDDGDASVTAIIAERGRVTVAYLLPVVVLAALAGVLVGLHSALREGSLLDLVGTPLAYAGLGVPAFWLAEALVLLAGQHLGLYIDTWRDGGLGTLENQALLAVAAVAVGVNVLAVQARYTRSESREYVSASFVTTLRSTGAPARDVARHVLRNAAVPLLSLLFTDVLVVVLITVYVVEVVLGVPGVGALAYGAIQNRDAGLILGTTLLPMLVVLGGNLLQDVAYAVLDPRLRSAE